MTERQPRSPAEWVTLLVSLLVLAVLVGLIVVRLVDERDPAAPVATIDGVEEIGDVHHVEVTVRNDGDDTAADVQIVAELVIGDETTEADQVLDFLAGDEEEQVVFVFEDDPADGELSVSVSGFSVP